MRLFPVLRDDIQAGVVWLQLPTLKSREIVKITSSKNNRQIYCEALQIEENFLRTYNQSPRIHITNPKKSLVISGWHRMLLGDLKTKQDADLKITPCNSCWGKLRACMQHPQLVVRISTNLGLIGLGLGILGLVLGVLPFFLELAKHLTR
jgi:hypothetical protein